MIVVKVPCPKYSNEELAKLRKNVIDSTGDSNVIIIPDDTSIFTGDIAKKQLLRCKEAIESALSEYNKCTPREGFVPYGKDFLNGVIDYSNHYTSDDMENLAKVFFKTFVDDEFKIKYLTECYKKCDNTDDVMTPEKIAQGLVEHGTFEGGSGFESKEDYRRFIESIDG